MTATAPTTCRRAHWHELTAREAHDLLRLRVDVFVVEQRCPYPELDGRDVEPATEHVWVADDAGPAAYVRVLHDGDAVRIGRVCTRADMRGRGLAAVLIGDVLARHGERQALVGAQAHLSSWYARFGFTVDGPGYVEDGIAHVPMTRPAGGQVTAGTPPVR